MAKLTEARSSSVTFDGAALLYIHSGEITMSTATQTAGTTLVPWDATIQKMWLNVRTTATITTSYLYFGKTGTASAYLNAYTLSTGTAGLFDIPLATSNSAYVSSTVTAGSVLQYMFTTGATAVLSVGAIVAPNAA